jgi:hypothetical protein
MDISVLLYLLGRQHGCLRIEKIVFEVLLGNRIREGIYHRLSEEIILYELGNPMRCRKEKPELSIFFLHGIDLESGGYERGGKLEIGGVI